MKYAFYTLAVVVLLAGTSLGVVSAKTDNGLPGVIGKLDEIKTALLGLTLSVPEPLDVNVLNQATGTVAFPSEMDVNIISPDPIDVNVVSGGGGSGASGGSSLAVTLLDNEPIAAGDEFVIDIADAVNNQGQLSISIWFRGGTGIGNCALDVIEKFDELENRYVGVGINSNKLVITKIEVPQGPELKIRSSGCEWPEATLKVFVR